MDIEATMKINALAKELVKKGIASTSEEASVLAEEMVNKKAIPREESVKTENSSEKYEILLERATRKLSHDISSLNEGMANIIKQLNEISEDIKRIKREQITEVKKAPEPIKQEKTEKQQKIEPKDKKQQFNQDDISVDKVFYFGKKE